MSSRGLVAGLREARRKQRPAFEFLILTATRTSEVLNAKWNELDPERRVWTISADRMKAAREHRVPLPDRARAIILEMEKVRAGAIPASAFVFSAGPSGAAYSNTALLMMLRRATAGAWPPPLSSTLTPHRRPFPAKYASRPRPYDRRQGRGLLTGAAFFEKRRRLMSAWPMVQQPAARRRGRTLAIGGIAMPARRNPSSLKPVRSLGRSSPPSICHRRRTNANYVAAHWPAAARAQKWAYPRFFGCERWGTLPNLRPARSSGPGRQPHGREGHEETHGEIHEETHGENARRVFDGWASFRGARYALNNATVRATPTRAARDARKDRGRVNTGTP